MSYVAGMDAWFTIESEPGDDLIRLTLGGFFTSGDVDRLGLAMADAVRALGCRPNDHLTLCDITAMNIQSQDVVAHFGALVGRPDLRSRRLAFITGATLARPQARRLADRPGVMFFSERDAASSWLLSDRAQAA